MAVARYFPQRVAALALIASHVYADSPEKKTARFVTISKIKKEGISASLSIMPEKFSYNNEVVETSRKIISSANRDGVLGVLAGMAERLDSIDLLENLDIPKMVIAGLEDQIIPIETSRKMVREIKNARLEEISKAGHLPMLDQSEQTASALLSFIKSF